MARKVTKKDDILKELEEKGNVLLSTVLAFAEVDFDCLDLKGVKLIGADLRGIEFIKVDFGGGKFKECNFEESNFSMCDFSGSRFGGNNYRGVRVIGGVEDTAKALKCFEE